MKPLSLTIGSLFAGIGGFDLAAEWMGWRTIWFSEIDPYASAVLRERFPGIPNLGDITRIAWDGVAVPDVLCGGFPCQPHSQAGNRKASADERDLWGECVRTLRELRPRYAVFENVPGLLTSEHGGFFNRVLSDLAGIGYDAEWEVLRAEDHGIPQARPRVFLVGSTAQSRASTVLPSVSVNVVGGEKRMDVANPKSAYAHHEARRTRPLPLLGNAPWPQVPHGERSGDDDRLPRGLDLARYKAIGNAIVPQCAVVGPFRRIQELEGMT